MDIREKLVELLDGLFIAGKTQTLGEIADDMIANGVTVQEHGRWLYSSIENPTFRVCDQCAVAFVTGRNQGEYNYCPSCGAKMLPTPPKGE